MYAMTPRDRVLQFASINFDASVEEIFSALLHGAALVLRGDSMLDSPRRFREEAAELGVTILIVPTAYWHELAAGFEGDLPLPPRIVSIGGEKAGAEPVAKWLEQGFAGVELINVYGPTEATVGCTLCVLRVPEAGEVPIGRPFQNGRCYLLDAGLQPVPAGAVGELFVGGDLLARGYLGRASLTAERFLPDPFGLDRGARMYRTGDLAVHRPDGTLEYRARADAQVKVRGFRIELGDVEAALARHPGVRSAAVLAREDSPGEIALAGYVVPGEPRPTGADLHRFLREHLPAYMVPASFTLLDRLPLTANGKVDRAALPAPERERQPERDYLAPRDTLELQLVRIWEDLLKVQPVGVRDDFFELGGHSLLAVQVVSRIKGNLGASLPMAALLRNPTVERLAAVLRDGAEVSRPVLVELAPGRGAPFFCVHAIGGEVFSYVHLARHLSHPLAGQPVYGLQAPEETLQETLEEMAAFYVRCLREVQPSGPYSIGGWSLGGVVAFEMARQLEYQGETVALLALIDATAPGEAAEAAEGGRLVALFAADLARLYGLGLLAPPPGFGEWTETAALDWVASRAEEEGLLPPGLDRGELERRFAVFRAEYRRLDGYSGEPSAVPLLLLRAAQPPGRDPELGWARLSRQPVEVREIPGDHYTLLQEPHVRELASILGERLPLNPY